jgi:hypothetical protein
VGWGIALPFRDLGTRRGVWSASHTGRFTPGKDSVTIVQETGWDVIYKEEAKCIMCVRYIYT